MSNIEEREKETLEGLLRQTKATFNSTIRTDLPSQRIIHGHARLEIKLSRAQQEEIFDESDMNKFDIDHYLQTQRDVLEEVVNGAYDKYELRLIHRSGIGRRDDAFDVYRNGINQARKSSLSDVLHQVERMVNRLKENNESTNRIEEASTALGREIHRLEEIGHPQLPSEGSVPVGPTETYRETHEATEALMAFFKVAFNDAGYLPTIKEWLTEINNTSGFRRPIFDALKRQDPGYPTLFIEEGYEIMIFSDQIAYGKPIDCIPLGPVGKATISTERWRIAKRSDKEMESIVESSSKEAEEEFKRDLEQERSRKSSYSKNRSFTGSAGGSYSFGVGSVNANAKYTRTTNRKRESLSRDVMKAVSRNLSKVNNAREMRVERTTQVEREEGVREKQETEMNNLNTGHLINVLLFQLVQGTQEVMCLTDVKVGLQWRDGQYDLYPVSEIDDFGSEVVYEERPESNTRTNSDTSNVLNTPDKRVKFLKELVLGMYGEDKVKDYEGSDKQLVEKVKVEGEEGYYLQVIPPRKKVNVSESGERTLELEGMQEYVPIRKQLEGEDNDPYIVRGVIIKAEEDFIRTDAIGARLDMDGAQAIDSYGSMGQYSETSRELEEVRQDRVITGAMVTASEDKDYSGLSQLLSARLGHKITIEPEEQEE